MAEQFSERQIRSIMIAERLASILSLLGSFYIIVTFLSSCAFHKPINRLIFCACFGNIIVSVATIISRDGMFAGDDSRLCQMQAFMIQMFLPADLLWTLVSAFNVYLTFFKKYTSDQLKALEWKYILACYGIPFIPAFVYIFVRSSSGARIYGPAEIWCWITVEWRILRVAALYAPIWIAIFLIIVIYASVGFEILKKHRQLRKFRKQQPNLLMTAATQGRPWVLRTTDVQITHECINQARETRRMSVFSVHSNTATNDDPRPYTITIESAHSTSNPDSAHRAMRTERIATAADANAAAWTYTRTAFFLFIGILFTWVPSSVYRIYALVHPEEVMYGLQLSSAIVLPLQGFWNSVVYVSTSQKASKAFCAKLMRRQNTEDIAVLLSPHVGAGWRPPPLPPPRALPLRRTANRLSRTLWRQTEHHQRDGSQASTTPIIHAR